MNEQAEATLAISKWAAEECDRQRVGPRLVPQMIDAALWLEGRHRLSVDTVQELGSRIDWRNKNGWRQQAVTIGGHTPLPDWQLLPDLMSRLVEQQFSIPIDEFYREFEEIHPFIDGNGRVGSILWNWRNKFLEWPYEQLVAPPDFWSEKNQDAYREEQVSRYGELFER